MSAGPSRLENLFDLLSQRVFAAPSTDQLFNPYRDFDSDLDRRDAVEIRRSNLLRYLAACPSRPDVLMVAEAPGPHGCRFTGVPFTCEQQMLSGVLPFEGRRTSLGDELKSEYSSRIVWGLLADHFSRVVIWSTVPLHPHKPGEPISIRTPTAAEIRAWSDLIPAFIDYYKPRRIAAIGRVAERACGALGIDCTYVRHPSQGGANAFRAGIGELLDGVVES
jgi:hypothetical protein